MSEKPNHWRTGVIAAVVAAVVAGAIGAVVWIHSGEQTTDQKAKAAADAFVSLAKAENAAGTGGEANILLGPKTRCLINRSVGVATFMINLRNKGTATGSAKIHPSVYFKDGGLLDDASYDRRESVVDGVPDSLEIDLTYDASRRPKSCHVKIGKALDAAIPLRQR